LSRRALTIGAGLGVIAGGLEWASLRGGFDHRRSSGIGIGSKERYGSSLHATESGASGIIHVAHSTHVVVVAGQRFLTDPWFYDPAFGALSHEVKPAVLPSELGPLTGILLTHDHADHADLRAMDEMDKRAAVIAPTTALAARVRGLGFSDVAVLDPWQKRAFGEVVITAVPALHDVYEVGFIVQGGDRCVYFACDTALYPDLAAVGERFRPDIAILPVDGTRLTGGGLHVMTPADATTAARLLCAKAVMPSHAEAYFSDPLVKHALASMVTDAARQFAALVSRELPHVTCSLPAPGELVAI
jgi:L-ascorbate metabolism protein UlaG (beta-lactamase superfamily)